MSWRIETRSWDLTEYWVIVDEEGTELCQQPTQFFAYTEGPFIEPDGSTMSDQTVRSITASPELLEACQFALDGIRQMGSDWSVEADQKLTAAINKATAKD